MIPRRCLVERVRRDGYVYRTETARTQLYRKPNVTHRLAIPKSHLLSETQVRSALAQADYSRSEIDEIIAACRNVS